MPHQFFVQMAGAPGAGKSTIARAVAQQTSAVVIDHDVTFLEDALLLPAFPVTQYGLGGWCLQKLFDQTL